jgi:hypothetical protein
MPIWMSKNAANHYRNCTQCDFNWRTGLISNVPSVARSTSEHHSGASWCGRRSSHRWVSLFASKGEELNNHVERLVEQVNAAGPVAKPMDVIVECSVCYVIWRRRATWSQEHVDMWFAWSVKNMHTANVLHRCHTSQWADSYVCSVECNDVTITLRDECLNLKLRKYCKCRWLSSFIVVGPIWIRVR